MQPVGIFGGTFDPIHLGHLHLARTVMQQAGLQSMKLIPCYQSPLRVRPQASAVHRVAMIKLALAEINIPHLTVDAREADSPHISYAVNTLQSLRDELGDDVPLCFIMAQDAFAKFTLWHDWQRILQLCHLIVTSRPSTDVGKNVAVALDAAAPSLLALPSNFPAILVSQPSLLATQAAGYVWFTDIAPLNIAATTIRVMLKAGEDDVSPFLPYTAWEYIKQQKLYR